MPEGRADTTVEIVGPDGNPNMTVAVVGDQVVDLSTAATGDVLAVQDDGTVAPERRHTDYIETLEAQTIWVTGASWEGNDTKNVAGGRAVTRLFNRSRAGTLVNKALSGRISSESAGRIIGNADVFAAGTKALFVAGPSDFMNHLGYNGYATAVQKATLLEPIRALLAAVSAASRVEASTMTRVGTWTQLTGQTRASNGNAYYSTTPGDYCEKAVTVTASGKIDVLSYLSDDAGLALRSGVIEVLVDGVLVYTLTDPNLYRRATGPTDTTYANLAIPLTGLSAGSHTIRFRHGGNGAKSAPTYVYCDAFFVRSATPPPIIVTGPADFGWGTAAIDAVYGRTTSRAECDALTADLAALCANEFPNAMFIDPNAAGFDYTMMIGDDHLHPNDRGAAFIADLLTATARGIDWTPGLHTQVVN